MTRGLPTPRWTECLSAVPPTTLPLATHPLVGVIPGEGIGEEVIEAALLVLRAVASVSDFDLVVETGGPIGRQAERECGHCLPAETLAFCREILGRGGAILCGPGGGRFVYELRRALDLFFKISPLRWANSLPAASCLKAQYLEGVDILLVRENTGGIYQGEWRESDFNATHAFHYTQDQVERFLAAASRLARSRGGKLAVVWKESGVPTISQLWKRTADSVCTRIGVTYAFVDIDLMAYQLITRPQQLDVIAAPNLFGDVLGDLGAVLLGSRGVSFSGNFNGNGGAVYQTNHGAAYDLAGKNIANPAGQIFAAAMMLRESFRLVREADAIERAVRTAWHEGFFTADLDVAGVDLLGTSEMTATIAHHVLQLLSDPVGTP